MFDDSVTHEILRIFNSIIEDLLENETVLDLETDIESLGIDYEDYQSIIIEIEEEFMCEIKHEVETIGDIAKIVMEHGDY